MSEFDLIRRHFTRPTPGATLGVGDDAALLRITPGMELAISTDMLVSGTHFLPDADPRLLGHKTLAVNLSDLAAMGAIPRWATLALSLPQADEGWLHAFSQGFFALADAHGVELIGGDTTRGPLNLCITIMGEVPAGAALRRDAAQVGDDIWVSGRLGDAALGLAHLQGKFVLPEMLCEPCLTALHCPQPRVALGLALRGIARSAIDVSDGLLADLGHIVASSGVGAELDFARVPMNEAAHTLGAAAAQYVLCGGDDYELCFTAPVEQRAGLERLAISLGVPLSRIGRIVAGQGCVVRAADGGAMTMARQGYDHFQA